MDTAWRREPCTWLPTTRGSWGPSGRWATVCGTNEWMKSPYRGSVATSLLWAGLRSPTPARRRALPPHFAPSRLQNVHLPRRARVKGRWRPGAGSEMLPAGVSPRPGGDSRPLTEAAGLPAHSPPVRLATAPPPPPPPPGPKWQKQCMHIWINE
jgi:hypothetical protein